MRQDIGRRLGLTFDGGDLVNQQVGSARMGNEVLAEPRGAGKDDRMACVTIGRIRAVSRLA